MPSNVTEHSLFAHATRWTVLVTAIVLNASANTITIPIMFTSDNIPYIQIHINDKNGKQITLRGLLDRGNGGTSSMNSTLAAQLGLNPTGNGTTQGVAGGSTADPTATLPATQTGTPVGGTGAYNATLHGTVDVPANSNLENDEVLLGADFYNQDPAGKGAHKINEATNTVTIWDHAQAAGHASLSPFQDPLIATSFGTVAPSSGNTGGVGINVPVFFGANSTSAVFVLSTGIDGTLISSTVAASLGIVAGAPDFTFTDSFGTFTVASAIVSLTIFPQQGPITERVGILPNSINPLNLSGVIGSGILNSYAATDVNEVTGVFSATPTPEPSGVIPLAAISLIVIMRRLTCDAKGRLRH